MTLAEMTTMLKSINGFESKVAYRAFPEAQAPKLPFICFIDTPAVVFHADNTNYYTQPTYQVELYEKYRDPTTELLLEAKFDAQNLTYQRNVTYLDTEKCWMIAYTMTTRGE